MGRPPIAGGNFEIDGAESLFRASVERGKPDFRFVALAIGAQPSRPPLWAMLECILAKDRAAVRAPTGRTDVDPILDEVVRFYAREQFVADDMGLVLVGEASLPGEGETLASPLTAAVRTACAHLAIEDARDRRSADNDWMRAIVRAWHAEQEEVDPHNEADLHRRYHRLAHWRITGRIARILEAMIGEENDLPPDMVKAHWIYTRITAN